MAFTAIKIHPHLLSHLKQIATGKSLLIGDEAPDTADAAALLCEVWQNKQCASHKS